jgi:hypothetical protein
VFDGQFLGVSLYVGTPTFEIQHFVVCKSFFVRTSSKLNESIVSMEK